jgi:hypothetical protein
MIKVLYGVVYFIVPFIAMLSNHTAEFALAFSFNTVGLVLASWFYGEVNILVSFIHGDVVWILDINHHLL